MKGILQQGDSDDGVRQVKFWFQTDAKVKSIHKDGVVTKLELQWKIGACSERI